MADIMTRVEAAYSSHVVTLSLALLSINYPMFAAAGALQALLSGLLDEQKAHAVEDELASIRGKDSAFDQRMKDVEAMAKGLAEATRLGQQIQVDRDAVLRPSDVNTALKEWVLAITADSDIAVRAHARALSHALAGDTRTQVGSSALRALESLTDEGIILLRRLDLRERSWHLVPGPSLAEWDALAALGVLNVNTTGPIMDSVYNVRLTSVGREVRRITDDR